MRNLVLSLLLLMSTVAVANTELEGLSLNGMAVFSELKRPIYLAALYVATPQTDADAIINSDEAKAMELTVTASRWSSRRFSEQLSRALLINNDLEYLKQYDVEVIEFSGVLKGGLKQGDKVVILRGSKGETLVSVNGTQLLELKKPGFYEMVLRVWIGDRPPSTDFKAKLLSLGAESQIMDLYATLEPSPQRIEEVAAWLEPEDESSQQLATVAVPAAAAIAAPSVSAAAPQATAQSLEIERAAKETAEAEKVQIAKAEKAQREVAAKIAALDQVEAAEALVEDRELREAEQVQLLELYQHMVVRGILSNVKYPSKAIKRNQQGVAMMELTVNRNGEIVSVVFLEKTRFKRLNEAAEEAVAGVGKFPAVPEALEGERVSVKLPVKFILS